MDLFNKTIVFAGDSITDMNRGRNEKDLNHIYGHSYVFLLASRFGYEFADKNISIVNRGVSSDTSSLLLNRWDEDVLSQNPDIISLLIGTNDILIPAGNNQIIDVDLYIQNLSDMYSSAKKNNPDVKFIICEPFAFAEILESRIRSAYNKFLPVFQKSAKDFAEKTDSCFVPLQCEFDRIAAKFPSINIRHWIWDGVHPTAAGHKVIEKQWLKYAADKL